MTKVEKVASCIHKFGVAFITTLFWRDTVCRKTHNCETDDASIKKRCNSFENRNVLYASFQLKINWNWFEKRCVKFSWSHFVFNAIEQVLGKKWSMLFFSYLTRNKHPHSGSSFLFTSFYVSSLLIIIFTYP